ncbi:phosphoribosyltransferase [Pilimelia terevasa]|uniref:Phosphoribosyltransferase n=1 Tax=Pilimelia terevasa TaxID=53372 RepID=A0A8J3BTR0_9ACTN|nr:phosphoribosyltransferase family protein [Pilimelia terevasa]GGK39986.1 phosphoribosyltransferase [Pilimelia terevasa]
MAPAPDVFVDRTDAGHRLAAALGGSAVDVVLGLPRGGVVVAVPVAAALGADLDIALVRKIGAPGRPEWGVGAVAEDERPQFDREALAGLGATPGDLADTVAREVAELRRRAAAYRGGRAAPAVAGRRVLVVDDGLATGVTAYAALRWLRGRRPRWLGFAAPVALADAARVLAAVADAVRCVRHEPRMPAVGAAYLDFRPVTDAEVSGALRAARRTATGAR